MKESLVYISHIAAPHQVKLCYELQKHMDATFLFYENLGQRAAWWEMDLGEKCKVLSSVYFKKRRKYITFSHLSVLRKVDPTVVMIGGFSIPANYLAYQWARWKRRKTIVFTERSRDSKGNLRKRNLSWRILRYLYRNVDMVMVSAEDIIPQFRDEFRFGDKVVLSQYASDIDEYFNHKIRIKKQAYTYLFANRLIVIYNPLGVIDIFSKICKQYPQSRLLMNAVGTLRSACEDKIATLKLEKMYIFLTTLLLGMIYIKSMLNRTFCYFLQHSAMEILQ